MTSGSGVYSGTDGWRRYWVDQNTPSAERPVEIAQRGQPGDGLISKPGHRLQPRRDLRQLRHPVERQLQGRFALQERRAGVTLVQLLQGGADRPPIPRAPPRCTSGVGMGSPARQAAASPAR